MLSTIKTDKDSHDSTIELSMCALIFAPLSDSKGVLDTNLNFNCRQNMIFNLNLQLTSNPTNNFSLITKSKQSISNSY